MTFTFTNYKLTVICDQLCENPPCLHVNFVLNLSIISLCNEIFCYTLWLISCNNGFVADFTAG